MPDDEELYRWPPSLAEWMAGRTFDATALMTREEGFARWNVIFKSWEQDRKMRMRFEGGGLLGEDEPDYTALRTRQEARRQAGESIGDPNQVFDLLDEAI